MTTDRDGLAERLEARAAQWDRAVPGQSDWVCYDAALLREAAAALSSPEPMGDHAGLVAEARERMNALMCPIVDDDPDSFDPFDADTADLIARLADAALIALSHPAGDRG